MNNTELRQYCVDVVKSLDIPERTDVNALCDRLEERRGRPISLVEVPMPTGPGKPCGLWVAADDADYICYQQYTTQAHQQHIISHELGHMVCDHEAAPVMPNEVAQLLMPTLSPDLVRSVLGRTQYSSEEERAAELVASLLPLQATAAERRAAPAVSQGVASLIKHLERSLERGTGG
ncbi:toxin [Streptomyces sp. bgisy100]|uniref:toxin n=1 Tax=Streptomyces sp. bgisy100 TaxID=3413783 RepID=UPI003D720A8F